MEHVTTFYKSLLGSQEQCAIALGDDFWADRHVLTEEERGNLTKPFQEGGVEAGYF
jgi:hypothetical protein